MKTIEQLLNTKIWFRRALIVICLLILGLVDFYTGYEFSFSAFYLLPVSLAAWYDHKATTILTIIAAALIWLWADFIAGHNYSNAIIPFWNACVRLIFFSVVAILMFKVRDSLSQMTKMAMQDALTGLHNSRAFQHYYEQLQKNNRPQKFKFAVVMIDLDGFKGVNDRLGHSVGDEVLRQFAQVLTSSTRQSDFVARMGGDEFAMILLNTSEENVKNYDIRLRQQFLQHGLEQKYAINFSMGVQLFSQLPQQVDQATYDADRLMYQSKKNGKSQTTIYSI